MNASFRAQKLAEIKNNDTPYMTGIRIQFEGETRKFDAYKIPLEYLIYNKHNGRIGSLIKSYEVQDHEINPEEPKDINQIEQFLWDSKKDRNKSTELSLVVNGQQKYGIVTDEGVIIDGNRRAYLLNKIYRERVDWANKNHNVDHCRYFIAVILDTGAEPREISKLETMYQMGEDEKLEYNAIEKYLKCKDLKEVFNFSISDIAEMMVEKRSQIEEWLDIMKLMDDYLSYLEYDGIYTRLENREGQFVDLNRYLNTYINGYKHIDWGYIDTDISDLKSICFDYIRAQYEGKEFRNIAQTSKNGSIFCRGLVWKDFLQRHADKVETIDEKSVEQWREENPDADLYKLLETRDSEWGKKAEKYLKENIRRSQRLVEDINESDKPQTLLTKALDYLKSIDTDSEPFYDDTNEELLKQIQKKAFDYLKIIRRHQDA
jgi:hypothetical protein